MTKTTVFTLAAATALAILLTGCSSSEPKATSQGVVAMTLKASGGVTAGSPMAATAGVAADSMGPKSATIVISAISARQTGGDWVPVGGSFPQTVDLLALVASGGGASLPAGALQEGSYDALQITITSASLTLQDDTIVTITPPGGGWVVLIPVAFEVVAGQETKITLNLRCDSSFKFANGEFEFEPEIEVEDVENEEP